MTLTWKKKLVFGVTFVVFVVYVHLNTKPFTQYEKKTVILSRQSCDGYRRVRRAVIELSDVVHDVLTLFRINHFLLYGSVWGPLRGYDGPLPWDYDVDLGSLDGHPSERTLQSMRTEFSKRNVSMKVTLRRDGRLQFRKDSKDHAVVDLFFFKLTWFGYARRTGIEPWLIPIHYYIHQSFPARLIQGDLPKVQFGGRQMQVPREGIEVMKYLSRHNWSKIIKPVRYDCNETEFLLIKSNSL